jgi:hypothetical protein
MNHHGGHENLSWIVTPRPAAYRHRRQEERSRSKSFSPRPLRTTCSWRKGLRLHPSPSEEPWVQGSGDGIAAAGLLLPAGALQAQNIGRAHGQVRNATPKPSIVMGMENFRDRRANPAGDQGAVFPGGVLGGDANISALQGTLDMVARTPGSWPQVKEFAVTIFRSCSPPAGGRCGGSTGRSGRCSSTSWTRKDPRPAQLGLGP